MGPTEWNSVNWRVVNRRVRTLRHRIFRASQQGDYRTVASLQKLMLRSYSNRLQAVRRVTQVNHGKRTAGVDQVLIKTPKARGAFVDSLRTYQPWRAMPTKRVSIPKANGTQRPLGIPTMRDRALQAMVKNSLEPSWEARFEGTNYGFRPGRGCHDAIEKTFRLARTNGRKQWVVDADIEGAFDHIDHDFLLQTIGPAPGRELIRQWLKAGYVDRHVFHPTVAGTPQGGVISPLLANIALHGMEAAIGVTRNKAGAIISPRAVVRYADDFVVFCETKDDAQEVVHLLRDWLDHRGLTLSTEKTRIVHLTEGFNFLGFNVRHYPTQNTASGYKLLIKPSRESVAQIRSTVRQHWLELKGHNVRDVLHRLNPIIRGQANYYRIGVASETFSALDNWMFHRAVRWVRSTHPTKPTYWTKARYWGCLAPNRRDTWVFGDTRTGAFLWKYSWFRIQRHILVQGSASKDDPALRAYWDQRAMAGATSLSPRLQRVARRQRYSCEVCGDSLFNDEELHRHHITPKSQGGTNTDENLTLRHLYCHQQIHATQTMSNDARELLEPDAVKVARPVLRGGVQR
jgi:RNA-directed DNA polymerase